MREHPMALTTSEVISVIIYLYVKTHKKTGLKYLGQTVRDPFKYNGSGVHWTRHLRKHGFEHETYILQKCYSTNALVAWGRLYSRLWNIVDSKQWANEKDEEGQGWGHGENNIIHRPDIKKKHRESVNSDLAKKRQKSTRLKNHGDETFNNRKQAKDTCVKKYGVDHHLKCDDILAKLRDTNNINLGVDYPMQSAEVRRKSMKTCVEKYGVDNVSKNADVKQKISNTLLSFCCIECRREMKGEQNLRQHYNSKQCKKQKKTS
jgi:hypothetical protein